MKPASLEITSETCFSGGGEQSEKMKVRVVEMEEYGVGGGEIRMVKQRDRRKRTNIDQTKIWI